MLIRFIASASRSAAVDVRSDLSFLRWSPFACDWSSASVLRTRSVFSACISWKVFCAMCGWRCCSTDVAIVRYGSSYAGKK